MLMILHSNILLILLIVRVGSTAMLRLSVGHSACQLVLQYFDVERNGEEEGSRDVEMKSTVVSPSRSDACRFLGSLVFLHPNIPLERALPFPRSAPLAIVSLPLTHALGAF